jgi:hypothetical protein
MNYNLIDTFVSILFQLQCQCSQNHWTGSPEARADQTVWQEEDFTRERLPGDPNLPDTLLLSLQ